MEQYKNLAKTTLNGDIANSDTTLTVTAGSVFPSVGNFRLLIGAEILLCTARASNVLTVTRGLESTPAVAHLSGTDVVHVVTDGSLRQIFTDMIGADTFANLPTAQKDGVVYIPSDSNYLLRDNASAWKYMHGMSKFTPPVLADFTWLNQGGATTDITKGGITVFIPFSGGINLRVLHKSKTPPYKITAYFVLGNLDLSYQSCGLGFYDPTSGKIVDIHHIVFSAADAHVEICNWNSTTSFNSVAASMIMNHSGIPNTWLQIEHDGTNLMFRVSHDGFTWLTIATLGKTAFMGTDPTKVCFFGRNDTGTDPHFFDLLSWKEE